MNKIITVCARTLAIWGLLLLCAVWSAPVLAQSADDTGDAATPDYLSVRTDDPRQTFRSFLRLSRKMEDALAEYIAAPTLAGVGRLALLSDQMNGLIDLSAQPAASRRETGIRTMVYLMDIFGRLPPVDPETIPDADAMEAEGTETTRIPGTPIYIARLAEADRFGEYLFVGSTVDVAPRFFRSVRALPLRTELPVDSLSALGPQLTGPMIPPRIVAAMPPVLRALWLDTPAWKVLTTLVVAALSIVLVLAVRRLSRRARTDSRAGRLLVQTVVPLAVLLLSQAALPAFMFQLNASGQFADIINSTKTILNYLAYAWLFWISIRLVFEWVILSPRIPDASLDANLLRLVANVLGIIGVVVILAFGGQAIGLPILSILAGLGIGGLAMALALQPTLENLVGGVILYLDRPVRTGDFCSFGNQLGTIESIGARSTKLRATDRTIITVPNAQLANLQIVNFAYCDSMLLKAVIGVRYETRPDQLRYLLAQMRAMLHAHPRIDQETVRVRFAGYGAHSLDIDLRVYVATREWNDFFAVREDVFLRIYDLVIEAGTGFALPSQTVYLGRDKGLDADRAGDAEAVIRGWRDQGKLPFPAYAAEDLEQVAGTLDYPPRGSVTAERRAPETAESLGETENPQDAHIRGEELLSRENREG
jgi:MscS family membrane protein